MQLYSNKFIDFYISNLSVLSTIEMSINKTYQKLKNRKETLFEITRIKIQTGIRMIYFKLYINQVLQSIPFVYNLTYSNKKSDERNNLNLLLIYNKKEDIVINDRLL